MGVRKGSATFFSLSDVWCLAASSSSKPDDRDFVVDSEAPMHMLSKKALNSIEQETVRASRNRTTVITSDGEVQDDEPAFPVRLQVHLQYRYRRARYEMILRHIQQPRSRSKHSRTLGDQLRDSKETPKNTSKNEDIDTARGTPLRDLPE